MTLDVPKSRLKIIHSVLNETPKLKWMENNFFMPDLKVEWNKTASNYVRLTVCLLACCFWEFGDRDCTAIASIRIFIPSLHFVDFSAQIRFKDGRS